MAPKESMIGSGSGQAIEMDDQRYTLSFSDVTLEKMSMAKSQEMLSRKQTPSSSPGSEDSYMYTEDYDESNLPLPLWVTEVITTNPQQAINLYDEPWSGIWRHGGGEAIIGVVDEDVKGRFRLYASMKTLERVVKYYLDQCKPIAAITRTTDELMDRKGTAAEASKHSETSSQCIITPLRVSNMNSLTEAVDGKGKQSAIGKSSHLRVPHDPNFADDGTESSSRPPCEIPDSVDSSGWRMRTSEQVLGQEKA
ncbi:MAG: hypothetical protein Q9213_002244 [Squamulea squamosa]